VSSKTTSDVSILALINLIQDHGMSASEIESITGIEHKKLSDPDARISMKQYLKLWEIAIEVTDDPALGLHLRERYGSNTMHFVIILALNSNTILDAAVAWARYDKLICDIDRIEFYEEQDHYILSYTNTAREFENRWIPELYFSLALEYGSKVTHQGLSPVAVWFKHKDPGYLEEYKKIFDCPIHFNSSQNLFRIEKEKMLQPIISPDAYLKSIMEKHARKSIQKYQSTSSLTGRVHKIIDKNLHTGDVTATFVSSTLNMDRSTLHRQLKKEGTSYRDIVVETRKSLSKRYLIEGLTATQTTYLLGFSEPSTFQRAFKGWFGQSPGEFKKKMLTE
jgi:AraC-like DNA-binding protein